MKRIFFTLYLSIISIAAFAQYGKDVRSLGDKAYANKDYYEAAYYYNKAALGMHLIEPSEVPFQSMNKQPKTQKQADVIYISYRLADSYRLYENYQEAEGWYLKVVQGDDTHQYPLASLWYGVCLRATQHFDEAIKQLTQFETTYKGTDNYKTIADKEITNCNFAKDHYQYPHLLQITKMNGEYNSDGSDYSIIKRDSGFYFTSSRYLKEDKRHLNRIYSISGPASIPQIVVLKDDDHKNETEYGTPSFSPDGKRMYFTRWYKIASKSYYGIYFTDWQNNQWSPIKKLNNNVNADGYNAIQPFVTADGKKLFFTSNKPGGFGGDDIWECDLGNDGDAINSTNLGSKINTAQDEQAPYYDSNTKQLIYSSKGFTGLGGFDFFESYGNNGSWSAPKNMGYPMNSAKDDLYYYPDKKNPKKAYISSDRQSDCCLDLFEVIDKSFVFAGIVTDCATNKPLAGVKVSFIDSLDKSTLKEMVTGDDAKYSYNIATGRPFHIVLEKKGYFTKVLPASTNGKILKDTLYNAGICLQPFEKNKPIVIKNILYDFNKATLRPESEVVLNELVTIMNDNPKIVIELGSHTDSIGSEKYNLKLSQARAQSCVDYIISKGINDKRILAKGYGKSKPIAPNSLPNGKDNPDGRQLNRRTEFTVLKTED